MGTRVQLHNDLKNICDNVYYQTPESINMVYPAIRYDRITISIAAANNKPYKIDKGYRIVLISSDADDPRIDEIAALPTCSWERNYKTNNLYHDVFNIYY